MTTPDLLVAALPLHARGWKLTLLNGKIPTAKGWLDNPADPEVDPEVFHRPGVTGIGVILDLSKLVDLEGDCAASEFVIARLAPPTGCRWKSPTQRHHQLYPGDMPPTEWTAPGTDETLVELRAGRQQSVLPPSYHPQTHAFYEWVENGEPTETDERLLRRVASLAAVAGALARHWEQGSRHKKALCVSGYLRRAEVTEEEALVIVEAICRAAEDEEQEDRLSAVRTTYEREDGEKISGLPTIQRLFGRQVTDWLAITLPTPRSTKGGEDAEITSVPWPEPLAAEAYHGLAGDIVRTLDPHSEADPVAIMFQLIAGFGCAAGRHAHFTAEADRHYTNLFGVLVGRTAKGRKGTSWGQSHRLLSFADGDWANSRIASGLSSGEGLIWAVRDPIEKQVAIKENKRVVDYEMVIEDPGVSDKRLFVIEPEFATVLRVLEREGNKLSAVVRMAWDTGTLASLTKNSPARATNAHIAAVGHVTKAELLRYLGDTEKANGFGNRFLWLCVSRSKSLPDGAWIPDEVLKPLADRLTAALQFAKAAGAIHRDDEAREIWRAVYDNLSEGKTGLLGAMIARAEAQVMRLACVYALLDCSSVIGAPHLQAALAWWEYAEASARFIFGDSLGDPAADELLRALRRTPEGMTRTQIRDFFSKNKTAEQIGRLLEVLTENGLVRCRREPTEGRPTERWFSI